MTYSVFFRLLGLLSCLTAVCLLTGCGTAPEETTPPTVPTETVPALEPLPDSELYYGEILKISYNEDGSLSRLLMESPKDGKWGMNLGEETLYIDSGRRIPFDPQTLQEGDRVYVFRSPITARSLPPQSPAFVVLNNIPMDASCAMYHLVEEASQKDGTLTVTTDHGKLRLAADETTVFLNAQGEAVDCSIPETGTHVLAWYWNQGETTLHPSHLMLLP